MILVVALTGPMTANCAGPEDAFAQGRARLTEGNYDAARKAWAPMLTHEVFGPVITLMSASERFNAEQYAVAEQLLADFLRKPPPPAYAPYAKELYTRTLWKQQKAAAVPLLEEALASASERDKPALLLKLAGLQKKLGAHADAAKHFRTLYLNYPASKEGLQASEDLGWMVFNHLIPRPEYTQAEQLGRAERLFAKGRFDLAAQIYESSLKTDPKDASLQLKLARAKFKDRRNAAALAVIRELYKANLSESDKMETLHLEALIHWRLENEKEFQRVVKEILAKGTPKAKKRALTNLAAFHLERGALGQAEEAYKQLSAIETEATPKTEIRWRLSWVKFRRKHYTHAADSFKDTAASAGPKWEHAARYWQARSLMAAGKPKDAAAPLKSLVKACPLDYYGIEAEKLLSKLGESPQSAVCPPFPSLEPTPGELERPEVATALKLMSAGLPEFALLNLEAAPKSVRSRPGVAFMTARAYFAAGKRHQAHEALVAGFGGLADNPPENAPPEFVEIAFPRLHTEHTRKTAARHGIDPHLIWAVIRQESRYDAGAVSPAGALGLMQIMPASAGINPGKGAASAKATAELLEPVNNISHGARILAKNLTQFQGRLVPAIASYNADIKKVKHWVLRHKNLPNDEFIESIPYTETRQYVKKVLSGYRAYRKIYEKRDVVGLW